MGLLPPASQRTKRLLALNVANEGDAAPIN
jgi:hypothetical protein